MELKYWIGEKKIEHISGNGKKNPEIVMKCWQSEGVLWVLPAGESSIFWIDPILGYRNNLHSIYVENEKEFLYDRVTGTPLEVQEAT